MKRLLFLLIALLLVSCSSQRHIGPATDHFDGEKFFNPYGVPPKSLWEVLKWQLGTSKEAWPDFVEEAKAAPVPLVKIPGDVQLTFVNHATVYIQTHNLRILTDPIWSERSSPVSWAGPKRVRNPSHQIDELPGIDIVLVSHNHYDHFDEPSLKKLKEKFDPLFLVPLGDGRLLEALGITRFKEMDWNDVHVDEKTQSKIHFVRCNHWSARGVFDRNHSLWGSFVIETQNKNIYFAGDTGYGNHFLEAQQKWGSMDVSLLPIGAYEPRWFMKDQHMNPEDAVQAHLDLKSKRSFGIHFRTFQLTNEGMEDPAKSLGLAKEKMKVNESAFIAPVFGEHYLIQ